MGFTNLMKGQEDPDGDTGHIEREVMDQIWRAAPKKRKFSQGGEKVYTVPVITKAQQRQLDIAEMKKNCNYWKPGCQIINCWLCKRKEYMAIQEERSKEKQKKLSLIRDRKIRDEWREIDMNREEYWKSEIAFECPITNAKHTINDCFEKCDMWGREYQVQTDGRTVAILHCCVKMGEPELLSGKQTRDN